MVMGLILKRYLEQFIKENGKTIENKVKVFLKFLKNNSMKVFFQIQSKTDMEKSCSPMEISIKVNIKKANLMAVANILGKMEPYTKANFRMGKEME